MTTITNPTYPDWITENPGENTRNVIDHYKTWEQAAIRADLDKTALPMTVIAENFAHDFNISTVVRNVNAFNLEKIVIAGRRQWDKRGAVGLQHYTHIEKTSDLQGLLNQYRAEGRTIIALDNVPGSTPLHEYQWPAPPHKLALILGQEQIGTSNISLAAADYVLRIEQFGAARSLNVGVASGIALHAYSTAHMRADS